ncbi:MAG: putative outer rane usher protein fimD [Candidatus Angelobacter sp.]|jgi:outer membrane usher protein|nr:putative outer rane usher protein fimD [Candidatus Angelobacter sp.]
MPETSVRSLRPVGTKLLRGTLALGCLWFSTLLLLAQEPYPAGLFCENESGEITCHRSAAGASRADPRKAILHRSLVNLSFPKKSVAEEGATATADFSKLMPVMEMEPAIGTEVFASVRVNGRTVADFTTVLRSSARRYLVKREVFEGAHLPVPSAAARAANGEEYFDLGEAARTKFKFDPVHQSLSIDVSPDQFERTVINASFRPAYADYRSSTGFLLNHELEMDVIGGRSSFNGFLEPRVFSQLGVLSAQLALSNSSGLGTFRRLQTNFVREMPDRMTTLIVGDSVTRPDSWGRAVNFAGVRWTRNFGSRPDFFPYPLPGLAGQAAEASTIELYANNVRLMQKSIDAGPFSIANIPIATGSGDLRLVVTDVFGRQQIISAPYLSSTSLLRKGVSDFDYSAGLLRWGFGGPSDSYHTAFLAGSHRYGISSALTLGLRGEVVGSTQAFGGGADFKLPPIGIFSAGLGGSHSVNGMGGLGYAQVQSQSRAWGYSAAVQSTLKSFRQLGFNEKSAGERLRLSGSLARSIDGKISLGLGYIKTASYERTAADPNATFSGTTGSFSVRLGRFGTISTTTLYAPTLPQKISASMAWTLPLGRRTSVTASSQVSGDGASGFVETGQSVPAGNGYGYRMRTALNQKNVDLGFDYQNRYGTYTAETSQGTTGGDYRFRERAGLVGVGSNIVPARWQYGSFAVVNVEGNKNVAVYSNNQEIGKTDWRGLAVVPLVPYDRNVIRLDDSGLPVELSMDLAERQVVTKPNSGLLVRFSAARNGGLTAVLHQRNGQPVPPVSDVSVVGSDKLYVVGYGGEVYLPDVSLPASLKVSWQGGSCIAVVPKQVSAEPLPHIGPLVCEAKL